MTSVTVTWTETPLSGKRVARAEIDRHGAGRRQRQAGAAERVVEHLPFPRDRNGLRCRAGDSFWWSTALDAGCRADREETRAGFIEWTTRTGRPQTPQLFQDFCKGLNARKGI